MNAHRRRRRLPRSQKSSSRSESGVQPGAAYLLVDWEKAVLSINAAADPFEKVLTAVVLGKVMLITFVEPKPFRSVSAILADVC